MSEMYKIVRSIPQECGMFGGSVFGAHKYHGFDMAKKAMFETIVEKFEGMDKKCEDLINSYCEEYYLDGAPEEFDLLKQLIRDFLKDPATFENKHAAEESEYCFLCFEDERVCFSFRLYGDDDGMLEYFCIDVSDEAKNKFPEGLISTIGLSELKHPESERFISLTAGENCGLEVCFSLMTEDDENSLPFGI